MNCETVNNIIVKYGDTLPQSESYIEIQKHLAECPSCRLITVAEKLLQSDATSPSHQSGDTAFAASVWNKIDERARSKQVTLWILTYTMLIGALLSGLVAALLIPVGSTTRLLYGSGQSIISDASGSLYFMQHLIVRPHVPLSWISISSWSFQIPFSNYLWAVVLLAAVLNAGLYFANHRSRAKI